ncbi:hypothetical protein BCR32DRAFT_292293 [Anaeromyces robustus]|uniref:Increased recombination centers protein 6 n=1 Tax=Anaeromyces robustus TaxID=1754192 RepID=A0A1Y1XC96_9FUNG|nr:hypothetical protein BCR32DRAFT_292293 [Anaeromyces robustus]|eukprot:ORX82984.1 hypothetical protein BCR32DRAFT_292293 [Anaeromyces robustus]
MSKNKILVLGREDIEPFVIVKEILEKSKVKAKEEVTKDSQSVPWTINNKYYKANIQFWIDCAEPKEINEETKKHWKEIGNVLDGFIFVFDKYKPSSFEDIKKWNEIINDFDINVRLCIGKPSKEKSETDKEKLEKFYDDIENWTIENDFEYIDFENTEKTEEGKNGIERAIEALETNMWENAVMKKGNDKDENEDEDEEKKLMEEVEELRTKLFSKLDDDDGFDNLITNLKNLKAYGQNLPDDARRDLAAKVALSFEKHFGLEEEEDEELLKML